MHLIISGHQIDVTPSLKNYVSSKVKRLERHCHDISKIQVTLCVEKIRQIAEAEIHIKGGDVVANAESEDLYAAIDLLTDKLDRQLIKHKEKQVDRYHHVGSK